MATARCLGDTGSAGASGTQSHGAAKMLRGEIPNLDKMLGGQQCLKR